jgi:glycine cleavage system H protein
MPDYLETTIDKFTFRVAADRLYSREGAWVLWVQPQGNGHARVGLADYLQQHNGDMAFVTVKPIGTVLSAGDELAELETAKITFGLASPVCGKVIESNRALEMKPEIVNQDPYGQGWLAVIEVPNWDSERGKLLDARAYFSAMQTQAHEELGNP